MKLVLQMQVVWRQLHSKHKAALHRQYALGSTRPLEVSEAADEVSIILSYFLYGEFVCFHFVVVLQSCALPRQTFTTQGAMADELGPKQGCRVSVVVACFSESALRVFTMRVFCLRLLFDRT